MLAGAKLKAALAKVRRISVHGPWSRVVGFRYLLKAPGGRGAPQPLWGGGAKIAGARFTPKGGFDSIYLASDPITAMHEVQALVMLPGVPVPLRTPPSVVVTVDGIVSHVLDLTDSATLKTLGTNPQEMTGVWVMAANPPTQALARAAYATGRFAGIRYASSKHPGGTNLVVFPDRLTASETDFLEVYDPHESLPQRIGT